MFRYVRPLLSTLAFVAGSTTPVSGPLKATWEVTYRCNLRCKHCHLWQVDDHSEDLTTDEARILIRDAGRLGTVHFSFSGGEPFLRRDFLDLAAYAHDCGMSTGVNTNGTRLGTSDSARKACRSGLGSIFISLDSHRPRVHNSIRGSDRAYPSAVKAISNLLHHRDGMSPKVFVNTTISKDNVDDVEGVRDLAKRLGVDGMTLSILQDVGKYSPEQSTRISGAQYAGLGDRLCRLATESGGLIPHSDEYLRNFGTYLERPCDLYRYRCVAGYSTVLIHPNGDVHPCPVSFAQMGNIREKPFPDIWFSKQAAYVRRRIKASQHPICWFDCIAPLTILLHNAHILRLDRVVHLHTLSHIVAKLVR